MSNIEEKREDVKEKDTLKNLKKISAIMSDIDALKEKIKQVKSKSHSTQESETIISPFFTPETAPLQPVLITPSYSPKVSARVAPIAALTLPIPKQTAVTS